MFKALLILAVAGVALADDIAFQKCGNDPAPTKLNIKGCKKQPCPVYRGQTAIMDIDFASAVDAEDIKMRVFATVWGLTTEYKDLPSDITQTCNNLTSGKCPLKKGDAVTHHFEFPVDASTLAIKVNLKFVEENEKGEVVSCFAVDIQVR